MGIGRTTLKLIDIVASGSRNYDIVLLGRRLEGNNPFMKRWGFPFHRLRLPRSAEPLIKGLGFVELLCPADLYHATDFYMPLRHPQKAIATVHDLIFLTQPESMVDHKRLAMWVPDFVKECSHIIAVSEFTKQDIISSLGIEPDKVTVIHWGVDRDQFSPIDNRAAVDDHLSAVLGIERPYFLAVSCSSGRKNTPFLLSAYNQLLKDSPENDLVVIWNAPPDIRARYESSHSKGRIRFLENQTDEDLRILYCGATALIFPSLYEGFGLPILEAMSCGTPVITSNVTSMPEIGGDAAIYIDPYEEQSLVKAMELFENKDPSVTTLKQRGLERVKTFAWEECVNRTLNVYEKLLEE